MIALIQTVALAVFLTAIFVCFVGLYALACVEISKLCALISSKRKSRTFFKKIEEFRRDFA